jgi:hypothetical protein
MLKEMNFCFDDFKKRDVMFLNLIPILSETLREVTFNEEAIHLYPVFKF